MAKTICLNETITLMALGCGRWEYFNITCNEDLKEAYKKFDDEIAWGGDIELQYIDGCLSGYSCSCFEEILELLENYNVEIEDIRDILNATTCIKETEGILEKENYFYIHADNKKDAFHEYLLETNFFDDIPEHKHSYIDIEAVERDYYNINIYETDEYRKYLIISE